MNWGPGGGGGICCGNVVEQLLFFCSAKETSLDDNSLSNYGSDP